MMKCMDILINHKAQLKILNTGKTPVKSQNIP